MRRMFLGVNHAALLKRGMLLEYLTLGWTAATFIAMLLLAFGKRVTGRALPNEVLLAEGRVTLIDAYLAGAVLLGLTLNALLAWWWADPLASLVIVYYGIREASHALRGDRA